MSGISEKNSVALRKLSSHENGPFTLKEASDYLNMPERKVVVLLGHLTRKGWLSRIKRGIYLTVPIGVINPKEFKTSPLVTANHVFSPCYIGGWSAAEHWHLTEQMFNSVVVFTSKKTRSSSIKIKGAEFVIRKADESEFRNAKTVWIENEKILITNPSRTVADILNDPTIGGGISNCTEILNNYLDSEYKDENELLKSINELKNNTIFKRLGYLLEVSGRNMLNLIDVCLKHVSKGFTFLDPSIKNKGIINTKWNLRINAEIANDNPK